MGNDTYGEELFRSLVYHQDVLVHVCYETTNEGMRRPLINVQRV